jgi:CRP-like cAMP-binding protein
MLFDTDVLLRSTIFSRKAIDFKQKDVIFAQGDLGDSLFYIEKGSVKLTVTSVLGREAVIGVVDGGSFLGEGCVSANLPMRMHSAIALTKTRAFRIGRAAMLEMLSKDGRISSAFTAYLIDRCESANQDLASSLVFPSEKRLARALLALKNLPGEHALRLLPGISQQTLADMIGSTRQRVNLLLKRFKEDGFIEGPEGQRVVVTLRSRFPRS